MNETTRGWIYDGANSITKYVVAVEFSPHLNADILKEISSLHPSVKDELPRALPQSPITVQLGVGQGAAAATAGGVIFDRMKPDGTIEKQLAVMPNVLYFFVTEYTRWTDFWALAYRLLKPVLEITIKSTSILAVVLEVHNSFHWVGAETDIDCSELIQANCKFIAKNVAEHRSASHSFHGFATPRLNPKGRRVENINFAILDKNERGVPANLTFQYRDQFEIPIAEFNDLPGANIEKFIELKLKDFHDVNNERFTGTVVRDIWKNMEGLA